MSGRLWNLLPDLLEVLTRFSVAVVAALLTCVYLVNNSGDMFASNSLYLLTGTAAFLAAGAGHLLAESRDASRAVNVGVALVFALAAGAVEYYGDIFHTSALFLFAALVLGVMVAPFLRRNVGQGAVWLFNLRLGMAALLALIVGLVFAGGISAILAGLDFLLGFHIENDIYQKVWTIAVTFIGPVYGLSLVPRDLDAEINIDTHKGDLLERGVSVLVNYVMVPMAVIYALILHAYAAKIGFLGALPKGEIGTIVSLFAVGGTGTWLIGWPWREKGTALLRLFMRAWFWLLPIPVGLLVMAIWRRLSDYGVTPDRYGIALVAVWAVLVFAYLVWRRNRADLRAIIGAAAALFLIGSFGPQGAYGLTATSQFGRLQTLLERVGVLKDVKVVATLPHLEDGDRGAGYSMLGALRDVGALKRVVPLGAGWTDLPMDSNRDYDLMTKLSEKLALSYVPVDVGQFNFYAVAPMDHQWAGKVRVIGPMYVSSYNKKTLVPNGVTLDLSPTYLSITLDGVTSQALVSDIVAGVKTVANEVDVQKRSPAVVDANDHMSLIIDRADGKAGTEIELGSMNFWLVQHE